jgi:hypothetical protein
MEVKERIIPVTQINIIPSQANMVPGDTIFIEVEVLPEDASQKDFTLEVIDDAAVIDFYETTGMVIANKPGTAEIIARWVNGDVEGRILLTVIDATEIVSPAAGTVFRMFPNPNDGLLYISCSKPLPFHMVMTDLRGRIVFEDNLIRQAAIDIRHLPPGLYEAVIIMQQEIIRQKLVKL